MPALCPHFIAATFAHVAGGLALASVGASAVPAAATEGVAAKVTLLATLFGGMWLLTTMAPGALKYALAAAWALAMGILLRGAVDHARAGGLLPQLLAGTLGATLAMAALGLYDQGGLLGLGAYLFAALLGLIVARFGVLWAAAAGAKREEVAPWVQGLGWAGVALFSLLLAHDVAVLKHAEPRCGNAAKRGRPDYVAEALSIFLDVINLFSSAAQASSE